MQVISTTTCFRYANHNDIFFYTWIQTGYEGCFSIGINRSQWMQVDIAVAKGSHSTEAAVNKQLNDKERVAAALENSNLVAMVDKCLAGGKL